jgi:hypothetical protein
LHPHPSTGSKRGGSSFFFSSRSLNIPLVLSRIGALPAGPGELLVRGDDFLALEDSDLVTPQLNLNRLPSEPAPNNDWRRRRSYRLLEDMLY